MAKIKHIVFDKTGTLTDSSDAGVVFHGHQLTTELNNYIYSICNQSVHPLSKKISSYLKQDSILIPVDEFSEIQGKGLSAKIDKNTIRLGSASYLGVKVNSTSNGLASLVYVEFNQELLGFFEIKHAYRNHLTEVLNELSLERKLSLLSGDRDTEKVTMAKFFPQNSEMRFNQSPADKMLFIDQLRANGQTTAMIGDGLNDAGALAQSDVGIAVSDNTNNFSPACDAILDASVFQDLHPFLKLSKKAITTIKMSFSLSLIYNIVGLSFAVTGNLSPLVAAIIMPLSTITIVSFVTLVSNYYAKKVINTKNALVSKFVSI
jgi:Cu+-exporting ATPase